MSYEEKEDGTKILSTTKEFDDEKLVAIKFVMKKVLPIVLQNSPFDDSTVLENDHKDSLIQWVSPTVGSSAIPFQISTQRSNG